MYTEKGHHTQIHFTQRITIICCQITRELLRNYRIGSMDNQSELLILPMLPKSPSKLLAKPRDDENNEKQWQQKA